MHSFSSNLCLFAQLLAKASLFTGIGPGIVIIVLYVQVSGWAVSRRLATVALSEGNKPARNFSLVRAA